MKRGHGAEAEGIWSLQDPGTSKGADASIATVLTIWGLWGRRWHKESSVGAWSLLPQDWVPAHRRAGAGRVPG